MGFRETPPPSDPVIDSAIVDQIQQACAAVDERLEFDHMSRAAATERKIVLKLPLYEKAFVDAGVPVPLNDLGGVHRRVALKTIGHHTGVQTKNVQDVFADMEGRHSTAGRLRHEPERPIDRALDAYEVRIALRGYGPPRSYLDKTRVSTAGAALEMKCSVGDLDDIARRRLATLMIGREPGPIHSPGRAKTGPTRARVHNPAVEPLVVAAIDRAKKGFPEDPLRPGHPDLISFSLDAGVGVRDITETPRIFKMVGAAASKKPLIQHPLLKARRYTYTDMMSWARDPRRLEEWRLAAAEEEAEDDDEVDVTATPSVEQGDDQANGVDDATVTAAANDNMPVIANRKQIHALREFIREFAGEDGENELVPYDFNARLERAMANHYARFDPGWRGLVQRWAIWNDEFRATRPLPQNFALSLRILLRETGQGIGSLKPNSGVPGIWTNGMAVPSFKSEMLLASAAATLRTPLKVLKTVLPDEARKRLFSVENVMDYRASKHLPVDFETLSPAKQRELLAKIHWTYIQQGSDYGRRLAIQQADPYTLAKGDWPAEMEALVNNMRPAPAGDETGKLRKFGEKRRAEGPDGKIEKQEKPWRQGTIDMRERLLEGLFGYWARPRVITDTAMVSARLNALVNVPTRDREAEDDLPEFVREGGLGIPVELMKPAIVALTDLTLSYNYWKVRRSGLFTRTIPRTLSTLARMLRPEKGEIWSSPEMLADLEAFVAWWEANPLETRDGELLFDIQPFRDNWRGAVEEAYKTVIDDLKRADESDLKPTRDSFVPVEVFINDDRPMDKYMIGVRCLLAARPQTTISQHVHVRDCIQTLILVQTALRTHNMLFVIDAGEDMPTPSLRRRDREGNILKPTLIKEVKDGAIRWVVRIPSVEFKNHYSPFFENGTRAYEKVLRNEDGLYQMLEWYMTRARPYLLKGRKSDMLFISSEGNDLDEGGLAQAYKRITSRYFVANPGIHSDGVVGAMIHTMHSVRNVIATHIVKETGNLQFAAWALQDTITTLERHYARFVPAEKAKHADIVLARSRAAGRAADNDNDGETPYWLTTG